LVEHLFPRKDAVLHQLEPHGACDHQPGQPTEASRQDATPAPTVAALDIGDDFLRQRHVGLRFGIAFAFARRLRVRPVPPAACPP
jgi:hypothetical protein